MGVRYLEHLLIMTDEPEKTRDWWRDNLDLIEGKTPEFGFPVCWLFAGKIDVVHIAKPHFSKHQDAYIQAPDKNNKHGSSFATYDMTGSGRIDHAAPIARTSRSSSIACNATAWSSTSGR